MEKNACRYFSSRVLGLGMVAFASVMLAAGAAMAYVPRPCVGGVLPVATFKLLVVPAKGGTALPVKEVNVLRAGDKLRYEPVLLPSAIRSHARVAIVIAPAPGSKRKSIEVLKAKPARESAEWTAPMRASVIGVVFGPRGLSVKRVSSLVKNNPELVPELATYARQTATVNALVDTLSQYEDSKPGSEDLNSALKGFSAQYGVMLPRITPGTSTTEQAGALLQALVPAMANYDPLTSSRSSVVQQSAGLAASVAALFYGTPVGLAAGGAMLFSNLRTMMFPGTDFRSAFVETSNPEGAELCAKDQRMPPRTRIAYLWMLEIPDIDAPSVSLAGSPSLPLSSEAKVRLTCATNAQLRILPRARDWRLVSSDRSVPIAVKVSVDAGHDTLSFDLTHSGLPAGEYELAALWDWEPLKILGKIHLRSYSNFSGVKLTPASQDRLIANTGPVSVDLTGADFEFVRKVEIEPASGGSPQTLAFKLPKGAGGGEQLEMTVSVDTDSLGGGSYRLLLAQAEGNSQSVPLIVHPADPKIDNLPLMANLDQGSQVVTLRGTSLERIEQITSKNAAWQLAPATGGGRARKATIKLGPGLNLGETIDAAMSVTGIHTPVNLPSALRVAPPRPAISSVSESFPKSGGVALRAGEIPAGSAVSFALHTDHVEGEPTLAISCSDSSDTKQPLTLQPGNMNGQAQLDYAGEGVLFLSLTPGLVGQSGCALTATLSTASAGASNPKLLGSVIRLPVIEKFSLSDKKIGGSLYEGTLVGQNLQMIAMTGWNPSRGYAVEGIPTPVPGSTDEQTLRIALPWPPPSPSAPVYIWLRGENQGRRTSAVY